MKIFIAVVIGWSALVAVLVFSQDANPEKMVEPVQYILLSCTFLVVMSSFFFKAPK